MQRGVVVAERFLLEEVAASGGMADVYRATDRTTGRLVALKVLRAKGGPDLERFVRESDLLCEIDHPGIVRYVAHGRTADQTAYLALEWLEGETLSKRIARDGLTVQETVALGMGLAESLGVVHRRGVVHRDLKPSNVFLVDGMVDRAKLIDFGIARELRAREALTLTGVMVGTPGFMAPEQARGDRDVDARADVFALGCMLFRCLTGRTPFDGDDALAVLLKVVVEDAPRVRQLRADIPEALDDLVARMLAKSPAKRPRDGGAVAQELVTLGAAAGGRPPRTGEIQFPAITEAEQRLMTVVLARPRLGSSTTAATRGPDRARPIASEHGAVLDGLADGSMLLSFAGAGAAADESERAVRCALALRAFLDDFAVVVVSGNALVSARLPYGDLIDRGAAFLAAGAGAAALRIDEATAGLLDGRLELEAGPSGLLVHGERETAESARLLLGRPTTCVGRDRELASLQATFEQCAAESVARAVVVTGGAGIGKSRLRHELVARLRGASRPQVWMARGDPMRAGAPFGMLGQVVRRAARLLDGEPLETRQDKLRARVARHVEPSARTRVTEFLGELVGTPFPDETGIQLRAARQDAMLMGDQMRRSWIDFLGAECSAGPVVLLLEDLHWGDRPTVDYVDTSLRLLRDRPLFVLALARPEVHEAFPKLWAERDPWELRLGSLSDRSCERLVHEVLGAAVDPAVVADLVERSAGNAFFLEELVRAAAEGHHGDVPPTVIAMVQSRLEGLEGEARRVLRAGSVFGQVFWRGAVGALLGGAERTSRLDEWLAVLERGEWITRRLEAKFRGETEYVMRHALVREAAYEMLTDDDKSFGHQLAGAWLERAGEPDPAVVAGHFARGGALERAVIWYRRAAEQALEGNDLEATIRHAQAALECGAEGELRGELDLVRVEAHRWRGEHAAALRWAEEALQALPRGDDRWFMAAFEAAQAASKLGDNARLVAEADAIASAWGGEGSEMQAFVGARVVVPLLMAGEFDRADALHGRVERLVERFGDAPLVAATMARERAVRARFAGDAAGYRELMDLAIEHADRAGDARLGCAYRSSAAFSCLELGDYEAAVERARVALREAERMGLWTTTAAAHDNLGAALGRLGRLDEARACEAAAIEAFAAHGDRRGEGGSRTYLAMILRLAGDLAGAETEARRAVEELAIAQPLLPQALATLADVLLAQGRVAEALEVSGRAVAIVESLAHVDEGEALAQLAYAEALDASGDRVAARAIVATARERLLARAAKISRPAWRTTFLENVPEHARILALASTWTPAP